MAKNPDIHHGPPEDGHARLEKLHGKIISGTATEAEQAEYREMQKRASMGTEELVSQMMGPAMTALSAQLQSVGLHWTVEGHTSQLQSGIREVHVDLQVPIGLSEERTREIALKAQRIALSVATSIGT